MGYFIVRDVDGDAGYRLLVLARDVRQGTVLDPNLGAAWCDNSQLLALDMAPVEFERIEHARAWLALKPAGWWLASLGEFEADQDGRLYSYGRPRFLRAQTVRPPAAPLLQREAGL